jgi:putative ABC transport system permease protein
VQFIDELKPLTLNDLYRVQGVPGVKWAVRFYKGQARIKEGTGREGPARYQQAIVLGLDDATLVGAPQQMILGKLSDLRNPDAVIIDKAGFEYMFPGEPLAIGKSFEMNDHRAVIVGICKAGDTFLTFPILYTRYHQAVQFVPQERKVMSAVLVGVEPGESPGEVCKRIESRTGRQAVTRDQFIWATLRYFMKRTGIVINFSITVGLGFIVGCAIAGQTFFTFTLENLNQFGSLKAMGVTNRRIVGMVLLQAYMVGAIGYGLGVGMAAGFGALTSGTRLAFFMPWQVLIGTALAVVIISTLASLLSVIKVLLLEPAVVFRG